jgi:hypothetical protein
LFGEGESKVKNSKVAHEHTFGPPESKTLCPVVGVDCLKAV